MAVSSDDFERGLELHFLRGLREGQDKPSAARWATPEETTSKNWRFGSEPGMVFLGYRNGVKIGRKDDRHQVTIGGSRAGKGVSLIVPNLLTYEGSVLAIDPKGELARETALPRAKRFTKDCYVLDPFDVSGRPSASFNPIAEIQEHIAERPGKQWPYAIDDALTIADAIIVPSGEDSHWSDNAKVLVQTLILMTLVLDENERNLITVRNLLMLKDTGVIGHAAREKLTAEAALFDVMQTTYAGFFDGQITAVGAQFAALGDKERASILSSARTQTAFLDSPALQGVLTHSDFSLADLKRKPCTVYLCLPASNMGTHAKWLRIIITMTLQACERENSHWLHPQSGKALPVLFVLDEFAVLGHMRSIESAAGQMAGFGVKLWTVLQDISQLENNYKGTWQTFFGNAAVATFHGVSDMKTLKYLSERLGTRSFLMETGTGANVGAIAHGAAQTSETVRAEPLMATHEIELALARERGRMVILFPGSRPLILQRAIYHEDNFFLGLLK